MKTNNSLSLNEYYLWKKKAEIQYPWKRQFLNLEFLKYEEKRVNDCANWHKKFIKSEKGSDLDQISFYTVPIEIKSSWKAAIADFGNFKYVGLSALYNSSPAMTIALIPDSIKQPQDYRLIEITKSKRENVVNIKQNIVEPVAVIENWDYLKSDTIYVDVPYEKKIIQNIFNENLINDDKISLSFQSPIISAPYVDGSIGGITLSSFSSESAFAKEFHKVIQRMVPPEYRTLKPPEKAYKGYKFPYFEGINFKLAERPYLDNNILSTFIAKKYMKLEMEQLRRYNFNGEFSIFSTFNPDKANITQIWKELLKKFTATEVTLPLEIDKLILSDIDLTRLMREINEDLWLQIVHSRQYMPSINVDDDDDYIKTINLLEKDLDILLSDFNKQAESREYLVSSMLYESSFNLKRLAQSFARDDEKDQLNDKHLKKGRDLIVDNFTDFINHPRFRFIKFEMEKKKEDGRYSVIQTEIINFPHSSTAEIFEQIKKTRLFKDIYDLQGLLDWLHKKGYVITDSNKKYIWSGLHQN